MKRKIRVTKTVDVDVEISDDKLEEVLRTFKDNISSEADLDWVVEYIAGVTSDNYNFGYEYWIDGAGIVSFNSTVSEHGMKARRKEVDYEYEQII